MTVEACGPAPSLRQTIRRTEEGLEYYRRQAEGSRSRNMRERARINVEYFESVLYHLYRLREKGG